MSITAPQDAHESLMLEGSAAGYLGSVGYPGMVDLLQE